MFAEGPLFEDETSPVLDKDLEGRLFAELGDFYRRVKEAQEAHERGELDVQARRGAKHMAAMESVVLTERERAAMTCLCAGLAPLLIGRALWAWGPTRGVPFEDVLSVAWEAFLHTLISFDRSRNFRLSTFTYVNVRQFFFRAAVPEKEICLS